MRIIAQGLASRAANILTLLPRFGNGSLDDDLRAAIKAIGALGSTA